MTVLGVLTLVLGCGYAAIGGGGIYAGTAWLADPPRDSWSQALSLGGLVPAFLIMISGFFLFLGLLWFLAATGVLLRRQYGRILSFILAVPTLLLGIAYLSSIDQGASIVEILLGAPQIAFGVFSTFVLIKFGSEFSRQRI